MSSVRRELSFLSPQADKWLWPNCHAWLKHYSSMHIYPSHIKPCKSKYLHRNYSTTTTFFMHFFFKPPHFMLLKIYRRERERETEWEQILHFTKNPWSYHMVSNFKRFLLFWINCYFFTQKPKFRVFVNPIQRSEFMLW